MAAEEITEVVEEVVESVTEAAEDTVEAGAKLVEAKDMGDADGLYLEKSSLVLYTLMVGAIAGAIGGVVAYHVGKNRTKTKYESLMAQELEEAKNFYKALHKEEEYSTPEKAAETLQSFGEEAVATLQKYQGRYNVPEENEEPEPEEEEVEELRNVNVFSEFQVDDNFDLEDEIKNRDPENPYIIHKEEFLQGDAGFGQSTITYYEGDGALADERDQEIPFVDPIVGEANLQKFGHGSGDSRVLYVRNEKLSTDFEIIKSDGKFAHEVLGLEHSDGGSRGRQQRNQLRKFRGDDE